MDIFSQLTNIFADISTHINDTKIKCVCIGKNRDLYFNIFPLIFNIETIYTNINVDKLIEFVNNYLKKVNISTESNESNTPPLEINTVFIYLNYDIIPEYLKNFITKYKKHLNIKNIFIIKTTLKLDVLFYFSLKNINNNLLNVT